MFRHPDNRKWFALMTNIQYHTPGIQWNDDVDMLSHGDETITLTKRRKKITRFGGNDE